MNINDYYNIYYNHSYDYYEPHNNNKIIISHVVYDIGNSIMVNKDKVNKLYNFIKKI